MPEPSQPKKLPPNIVAQILLGEAASEGPEGIGAALDTMVNRARRSGKSLEAVALAPQQFSASARPDLEDFYLAQPLALRAYTESLVAQARNPGYEPKHPYRHYVTTELYKRRHTLEPDHWVHQMDAKQTIGRHVFLQDRPRPRR